MKHTVLFPILMSLALVMTANAAHAAKKTKAAPAANQEIDVAKDVDNLGGNQALYNMASSIDPNNRTRIVQQRIVDRHNRFELGLNYGYIAGGDSYMQTQSLGASVDFHFNPRFSLGVRYYDYSNNLTAEGKSQINRARNDYQAGRRADRFDIDAPLHSYMAIANWYPIYGKMNMMNMGISQFDVYLLGGAGQIALDSGVTGIYTAGVGSGIWINKRLTARLEIRYQSYKDNPASIGSRNLNETVGNFGMGIML